MLEQKIEDLVTPGVNLSGYSIVRVKFTTPSTLQVMIERNDLAPITVGDCVTVNNIISTVLDVEDIIKTRYNLEVSSPGLERPLVKLKDFDTYKGRNVLVNLKMPLQGLFKIKGTLLGAESENIEVELENQDKVKVEFCNIKSSKLLFGDV